MRRDEDGQSPVGLLAVSLRGRQGAGRAVWLCAQGAGRAVSFCAQGAGPAVYSRQPGAQSYWPGSPGPALAAPPPRWRRQPPAHKSGGCAACESAQPARAAAPPTYCQDLRSADARQTRCCLPERWLSATCGHPALMLSCRLPISRPGISLADPAGPKLHRSAILARVAFGAGIKPDLSADEHLRSPPGQRSRRQGRRSLQARAEARRRWRIRPRPGCGVRGEPAAWARLAAANRHRRLAEGNLQAGVVCVLAFWAAAV